MEEQTKSKSPIIIIVAIILAIGCGVGGYFIGKGNSNAELNETELEVTSPEKNDGTEVSTTEQSGTVGTNVISMNGKEHTLSLDLIECFEDSSTFNNYSLSIDSTEIIGSHHSYLYEVFTATDGKDYLLLGAYTMSGANRDIIVDENGEILAAFDYYVEEDGIEGLMYVEQEPGPGVPSYIEDGYFYYPSFVEANDDGETCIVEYKKVEINNGKITESNTGIQKTLGFLWIS